MTNKESDAYQKYLERTGFGPARLTTALIDMDGVLYDSMSNHSKAWKRLSDEIGWHYEDNEFFLYEGMTGTAIIRLMMKRECGRNDISDEEARQIYAKKADYFVALGEVGQIDGTARMLETLRAADICRVLVTGSGQNTLLNRLDSDYPGIFSDSLKVTAYDVRHGKPDPEPYLMGLEKSGSEAQNTIVIENAPLGVKAGNAAQCFTVGITTGPIPEDVLYENGADIVYASMTEFAEALPLIIELRNQTK